MENKNIIIGLLVVVIIVLAFFALRPMMYGPGYNQGGYYFSWPMGPRMGPGMMYGPGYGSGYAPGYNYSYPMMGYYSPANNYSYPMMGYCVTYCVPGYNHSWSFMGYGGMMTPYYPGGKPISSADASQRMESFARNFGKNIKVEDFMAFSGNYYSVLKDLSSNQSLAEVLVDRYSGTILPEPGPNMMWNTRYGSGRTGTEGTGYDLARAKRLAEDFLKDYLPGAKVMESNALPGYYTFDFGRQEIDGMLSVNANNGEIWVHTWHGFYLGELEGNTTS